MFWIIVYVIGYVLSYPFLVNAVLNDLGKIAPNDEGDYITSLVWSGFASLVWPVTILWPLARYLRKNTVVGQKVMDGLMKAAKRIEGGK